MFGIIVYMLRILYFFFAVNVSCVNGFPGQRHLKTDRESVQNDIAGIGAEGPELEKVNKKSKKVTGIPDLFYKKLD